MSAKSVKNCHVMTFHFFALSEILSLDRKKLILVDLTKLKDGARSVSR